MMESVAWRSLKPAERAVYVELRRRFNGVNNGWLALSVRDAAERCNINKDTASKALATLQERGFTECVTPGGFTRKVRHATEWRLLDERCNKTGALPSKAFMRWRPAEVAERETRSGNSAATAPSFRTVTRLPSPKSS
jgi:DNA-binding transcriptional regulator YhcF (GntR family)